MSAASCRLIRRYATNTFARVAWVRSSAACQSPQSRNAVRRSRGDAEAANSVNSSADVIRAGTPPWQPRRAWLLPPVQMRGLPYLVAMVAGDAPLRPCLTVPHRRLVKSNAARQQRVSPRSYGGRGIINAKCGRHFTEAEGQVGSVHASRPSRAGRSLPGLAFFEHGS